MSDKKKHTYQAESLSMQHLIRVQTQAKTKKNEASDPNVIVKGHRSRSKYEIVIRLIEYLKAYP